MPDLLTDIIAFLETHGMSESQFGIAALNDKNLVPQLRGDKGKPRRLWPETEERIRAFMEAYRPERAA